MLTKPSCGLYLCVCLRVWVCVCICGARVHDRPTPPLWGNTCGKQQWKCVHHHNTNTLTHTLTLTLRQTNPVRSLYRAPLVWTLPFLWNPPPHPLSLPTAVCLSSCKCHADSSSFLLKHIKPTKISLVVHWSCLSLPSLISTSQVNLLRGTALRLSQS